MTKNHMARLIIMALFDAREFPKSDNPNVIHMTKNSNKKELKDLLDLALNVFKEKPELVKNLTTFELPYSMFIR